jgi:hypothetical protein
MPPAGLDLKSFFEIGLPFGKTVPLCGNNQGLILTAQNPILDKQLKHINIKYYHIRQEIQLGKVAIYYVKGSKNPAELLIKNLPHVKFLGFCPTFSLTFN